MDAKEVNKQQQQSYSFFGKISYKIKVEGFTNFLYTVAARINYPRDGFPRYPVDKFMKAVGKEVKKGEVILDAGAGPCPYRDLFSHANYESCDYGPLLDEYFGADFMTHTFYCDLEAIPRESQYYDIIICNQVLEHVKRPGDVLSEFYRILKPGGKLFLTAPLLYGVHMAPFHFFNFTHYGLRLLFDTAGFSVSSIQPMGGIFAVLGKVIQRSYDTLIKKIPKSLKLLYFPIHIVIRFFMLGVSYILYNLDKFDAEKDWTLNYGCICLKPENN